MSNNGKKRLLQESMFPTAMPPTSSERKREDRTVIAHISDLHFTSSTNISDAPWETLLIDLVDKSRGGIDVLVVTGDLIDSPATGLPKQLLGLLTGKDEIKLAFERVSEYLLKLCSVLNIKPEQGLFVVPGNHDYRISGIHRSRSQPERFRECFENFCRPLVLPNLNLCVFVLDSNVMEFLDLASARVGDLEQFYKLTQLIPNESARFTRVALLHHHPMPIAANEKPGFLNDPGFTMLKNAGQFMTTMVAAEIDLILHGHEHYPAYSKAVYPYGKDEHLITVISAGSVGKEVCNYNLISITDNGQVHLERRSLKTGALYDFEYDKQLRDYEDARRARFEAYALAANARIRIEKSSRLYVIKDDSGDADLHQHDQNVSAYKDDVDKFPTYLDSDASFFFKPEYDNPRISWEWTSDPNKAEKRRHALVTFNPKLTKDDRISFNRFSKVFNLFQFNQQDKLAVSNGQSNSEEYANTILNVFDVLTVQLQFPKSKFPDEVSYQAIDPNGRPDPFEREYFARHVSKFEKTSSIVFTLEKPLPGYKYVINWQLPELEADELKLSGTNKASADQLVTNLLNVRTASSPHRQSLHDWIEGLRMSVTSSQVWKQLGGNDDLEISFYVYDQSQRGLVCIAASAAASQFETPSKDVIKPGKTLIGEAFRRRGPAFYNPLSAPLFDEAEYDDRIPDSWGPLSQKRYVAVCAIPLSYPLLKGRRIAVLSLASSSNSARLLSLMPDQNDAANVQEEKKVLQKSVIEYITGTQFGNLISRLGIPVVAAQKNP